VHVLFSPGLLAAIAIVAWIKFRPGRVPRLGGPGRRASAAAA